jgi:hypothetical protein
LVVWIGEDVLVTRTRRYLVVCLALALTLALTGCGDDGESAEERAEVVRMLERLSYGRNLAQCMADEFDGEVTIEQLQSVINARGDLSGIDFELTETMVRARVACEADD